MPKKMKNCHKFTNRMAVIWFGHQAKGATIKSQFTNCLWFHMCWIKLFSFWLSILLFFILTSSRFELWVPGISMVPHNSMPNNNSNDRMKKRKMSTMKERVCERKHKKKSAHKKEATSFHFIKCDILRCISLHYFLFLWLCRDGARQGCLPATKWHRLQVLLFRIYIYLDDGKRVRFIKCHQIWWSCFRCVLFISMCLHCFTLLPKTWSGWFFFLLLFHIFYFLVDFLLIALIFEYTRRVFGWRHASNFRLK